MKNTKKFFTRMLTGILSVAMLFGATACSCRGDDIDRSENTISIRALKAGYGVSYLTKFKEKFEALYADEGYKVQILTPSSDMQGTVVYQEMYTKNDWADLYFASGLNAKSGVDGDYGQVFADITDLVWNKTAIDFNGNEETKLVKDKLNSNVTETAYTYNNKVYCMPLQVSIGGMIVNFAKLKKYGYTELPRTSKELFGMFETIFDNTRDASSPMKNVYPLTFLSEQNGYHFHIQVPWLAQYMGNKGYEAYMSWTDEDGNLSKTDGYKVYEDPALGILLENLYRMYDAMYAAPGTWTNDLSSAHAMIMSENSGAVFMAEGDWAYNEIATDYSDKLDDIALINIPIISELGVKLFGTGTSYNYDEDKCEEVLSWTIKQIDEKKTVAQIKTAAGEKGWTLQDAEIERLQEARGVYCDRSLSAAGIAICEKSTKKDLAALFIRMFCSDDGSVLYNQETNGYSPYTQDFSAMKSNEFSKSYIEIRQNEKAKGYFNGASGARAQVSAGANLLPLNYFLAEEIIQQSVTAYDPLTKIRRSDWKEFYLSKAEARWTQEKNYAKDKWARWMETLDA